MAAKKTVGEASRECPASASRAGESAISSPTCAYSGESGAATRARIRKASALEAGSTRRRLRGAQTPRKVRRGQRAGQDVGHQDRDLEWAESRRRVARPRPEREGK